MMEIDTLYFTKNPSFCRATHLMLRFDEEEGGWRLWLRTAGSYETVDRRMLEEMEPISIPDADVQEIIRQIRVARIGFPKLWHLGRDGISYVLTIGERYPQMTLSWWEDLPPEWEELQPAVEALVHLAKQHGFDKKDEPERSWPRRERTRK